MAQKYGIFRHVRTLTRKIQVYQATIKEHKCPQTKVFPLTYSKLRPEAGKDWWICFLRMRKEALLMASPRAPKRTRVFEYRDLAAHQAVFR